MNASVEASKESNRRCAAYNTACIKQLYDVLTTHRPTKLTWRSYTTREPLYEAYDIWVDDWYAAGGGAQFVIKCPGLALMFNINSEDQRLHVDYQCNRIFIELTDCLLDVGIEWRDNESFVPARSDNAEQK